MIRYNPFLKLNRLVIYAKGNVAYDESFHIGFNIIRGHNSSGKSTISNFIFYVLGGDFSNWTNEALQCDRVYAEIEANGRILTIRRSVEDKQRQGMQIFFGNIDISLKSADEGWYSYSYRQTDNKNSFSNQIFSLLGLPELKGDVDNNITMHQILRLLYIDQRSLTESLMRTESFDSALTRKTVAELLYGIYDDSLYSDRLKLIEIEKNHDSNKRQYDGIRQIFNSTGNEIDKSKIQNQIEEKNTQIEKINITLKEIYNNQIVENKNKVNESKPKIIGIQNAINSIKQDVSSVQDSINKNNIEIQDSEYFITTLKRRIKSLEESITTSKVLGELPLTHCPQCLSILEPTTHDNTCSLCKQEIPEGLRNAQANRMLQELTLQLTESEKLLVKRKATVQDLNRNISTLLQKYRVEQNNLKQEIEKTQITRLTQVDELIEQRGKLTAEVEGLIKQLNAVEKIDSLKASIERADIEIKRLKEIITSKDRQQEDKRRKAHESISRYTLEILKSDLPREAVFQNGTNITLDFDKNTYGLDGRNNFSESSNTYLKNAIRFGIFFASLENEWFRYPRFIYCDNTEDKGMEDERSQNFQKIIKKMSERFKNIEHQIILTTSKISPELNNTPLCVGDFYDENNKSLKIANK